KQLGAGIGRLPGNDVVSARGVQERRDVDGAEVARHSALHGGPRLAQLVLQVGVPYIPAEHRSWQVGVVAVPIQQVEWRRGLTLQGNLYDIWPDQGIGPPRRGEHGQ